ncbi:MAG: HAMP domain-containing protein [Pseudomonadales bacterium]|nr:HAMP domain-containing protein [Pseudomonadales bacterium]MBO7006004.1 HAMP domain-containing protein [Pseudomonadales bacterium]
MSKGQISIFSFDSLVYRLVWPLLILLIGLMGVGIVFAPSMTDANSIVTNENWSVTLANQIRTHESAQLARGYTGDPEKFHEASLDLSRSDMSARMFGLAYLEDDFERNASKALSDSSREAYGELFDRDTNAYSRTAVKETLYEQGCVDCHIAQTVGGNTRWKLDDPAGYYEFSWSMVDTIENGTRIIWANVGGLSFMLLFMIGLLWFIFYQSITRPLQKVTGTAMSIAKGQLDESLGKESDNEVGRMAQSVEEMRRRLREIIMNLRVGADDLNRLTYSVYQGNNDLNNRTQAQASALEEITATIGGITTGTKESSNGAVTLKEMAREAGVKANEGTEVVGDAITAMRAIGDASSQIQTMIDLIDDMSFQTNLLALNAAVEAARAGENGKGFAVVANEVRNLATRSATAASEIKSLIQNSNERVNDGVQLVEDSGQVLSSIVEAISRVSETSELLVASSQEQMVRVQEIDSAIQQIDNMTQQNAALVEQVSTISEEMGSKAADLKSSVAYFETGSEVDDAVGQLLPESGAYVEHIPRLGRHDE